MLKDELYRLPLPLLFEKREEDNSDKVLTN
jgi:hypothetical protein